MMLVVVIQVIKHSDEPFEWFVWEQQKPKPITRKQRAATTANKRTELFDSI